MDVPTAAAQSIAVSSAVFAGLAAWAAVAQTRIQARLRKDSAQPYVWADIRPSEEHGQLLFLVVGNSGPTVAKNLVVRVQGLESFDRGTEVQRTLLHGVSALAPGRELIWSLGFPPDIFDAGVGSVSFSISAEGPFGPVGDVQYKIDLAAQADSWGGAVGTLRGVTRAIEDLRQEMRSSTHAIASRSMQDAEGINRKRTRSGWGGSLPARKMRRGEQSTR